MESFQDRTSFTVIYRLYVARVRATIYRIAGDQDLDDLTQECFVKIWKNIDTLTEPKYLSTWIYRVATNAVYKRFRDEGRRRRRERELAMRNHARTSEPETGLETDEQQEIG